MDHWQLKQALKDLPLGAIRYYDTIGSTNREAINWVEKDAPDLAIVIADEQTEGYGRKGRKWYTAKGDALAISLVLRPLFSEGSAAGPKSKDSSQIASLTALGALAVTETLRGDYNLDAKIKWPNDVLVNGYKLAGILAEAVWLGEILAAAVIGIGVNVREGSVPAGVDLDTPANCIENMVGKAVGRTTLVGQILENLLFWRTQIFSTKFLERWEKRLAYLGEWVAVIRDGGAGRKDSFKGQVLGLEPDGSLRIQMPDGSIKTLNKGAYRISPVKNKLEEIIRER